MAKQDKGNAQFCLYTCILDLMVYLGLLRVLHPDKKDVLKQSVDWGITHYDHGGCKESQFYGLPFGQVAASIY